MKEVVTKANTHECAEWSGVRFPRNGDECRQTRNVVHEAVATKPPLTLTGSIYYTPLLIPLLPFVPEPIPFIH